MRSRGRAAPAIDGRSAPRGTTRQASRSAPTSSSSAAHGLGAGRGQGYGARGRRPRLVCRAGGGGPVRRRGGLALGPAPVELLLVSAVDAGARRSCCVGGAGRVAGLAM